MSGRIDPHRLTAFASAVLCAVGVPAGDASLVSQSLVQADLWGHQSHGVMRLPWYVRRLQSGAMRAVTSATLEVDAGAVAVIDGWQPESVDYFAIHPIGPVRAIFRTESFSLPDTRPEVQAARVAAGRVVQAEDNALTESVQRGLEGSSYRHGYLSPQEPGVRAFRDWMRERLPIALQETRPWDARDS
jgi:phenylpropionate dioxygenase-like ring-hydroxylating dioxygenase large terminal subunit